VRQLDRQISSQFHTRAMLSKNRPAMLQKAGKAQPGDLVTAEEAIKVDSVKQDVRRIDSGFLLPSQGRCLM
jgi:predicted nuclease of restriction endonuclease-like (RecB) superfamily